jgi:hypothetical protein
MQMKLRRFPLDQCSNVCGTRRRAYSNELPASEIDEKHCERIKSRRPLMLAPEAAIAEADSRTRRRFEAVIKKGIIRKLSPAEIAALRKHKPV